MAKRREEKAANLGAQPVRWSIYCIGKKMARLGHVEAATESEAREKAYKAFKIAEQAAFRSARSQRAVCRLRAPLGRDQETPWRVFKCGGANKIFILAVNAAAQRKPRRLRVRRGS